MTTRDQIDKEQHKNNNKPRKGRMRGKKSIEVNCVINKIITKTYKLFVYTTHKTLQTTSYVSLNTSKHCSTHTIQKNLIHQAQHRENKHPHAPIDQTNNKVRKTN